MATAPSHVSTPESVLRSLCLLGRAVETVLDRDSVRAATGRTWPPSKIRLLRALSQGGPHTLGRAAAVLGVSEPAASQLVDSLVRARLIRRTPDHRDRRMVRLTPTAAGRRVVESIEHERLHRLTQVLQDMGMTPDQWGPISDTLRGLAVSLGAARDSQAGECLECGTYRDGPRLLQDTRVVCRYHVRPASRRVGRPPGRGGRGADTSSPAGGVGKVEALNFGGSS